jgi:hypothetical protein
MNGKDAVWPTQLKTITDRGIRPHQAPIVVGVKRSITDVHTIASRPEESRKGVTYQLHGKDSVV